MNMIPQFLKPAPEIAKVSDEYLVALDLDPDFEEACARSLQEPMQTDAERYIEATENFITILDGKDDAVTAEIAALRVQLAAKEAGQAEIRATKARAKAGLSAFLDAVSPSPKPDKPKKTRAGEAKAR